MTERTKTAYFVSSFTYMYYRCPYKHAGSDVSKRAADDSVILNEMRQKAIELARYPAYQNSPQLRICQQVRANSVESFFLRLFLIIAHCETLLQAISKYSQLALLLRGKYPSGFLLDNAPEGYILQRIKQLANGTCMIDFKWAGGNPEHPSDSTLLLYLFAAFLAAPQWVFTDEPVGEGPGGALYLGDLPPRVTGEFYAIIPKRPPENSKASNLLSTMHSFFTIEFNRVSSFCAGHWYNRFSSRITSASLHAFVFWSKCVDRDWSTSNFQHHCSLCALLLSARRIHWWSELRIPKTCKSSRAS